VRLATKNVLRRKALLRLLLGTEILVAAACRQAGEERPLRSLAGIPPNRWIKIHEASPGDAISSRLSHHGGACFDEQRRRVVLFGSDAHGLDFTNHPLVFDVSELHWSRLHGDDDPVTYRVIEGGIPVAGRDGEHPWAMHASGSVTCDPFRDEMIVTSYPAHESVEIMEKWLARGELREKDLHPILWRPLLFLRDLFGVHHARRERYLEIIRNVWPRIERHPTWIFRFAEDRWKPLLADPAIHTLFGFAVYDRGRGVVIGANAMGVYELTGEPRSWDRVSDEGLGEVRSPGAAFDEANAVAVVYGGRSFTPEGVHDLDEIWVFSPRSRRWSKMPTPGPRPGAAADFPMAYDPVAERSVIVVNSKEDPEASDTWLYELARDAWTRLPRGRLPFRVNWHFARAAQRLHYNTNLVYDWSAGVLLYVTFLPPDGVVSVWALRLDLAASDAREQPRADVAAANASAPPVLPYQSPRAPGYALAPSPEASRLVGKGGRAGGDERSRGRSGPQGRGALEVRERLDEQLLQGIDAAERDAEASGTHAHDRSDPE
jgi:hypothetical protein